MPKKISNYYPYSKHKEHISVTKTNMLMECSLKYNFKYKLGIPEEKKFYLTRGSVFHEILEAFLKNQKQKKDYFIELTKEKYLEAKNKGEPVSDNKKHTFEKVTNDIINAVDIYYDYIKGLDEIRILQFKNGDRDPVPSVEMEFKIPFIDLETRKPMEGMDYDLYGFIDLVDYESTNGLSIRDHKLISREYNDFAIQTDIQLGLYAYVFWFLINIGAFPEINHKKISDITVGFNSHVIKTNRVELVFTNKKLNFTQIQKTIELVRDFFYNEKNMVYVPNYGDHCNWKCGYQVPCLMKRNGEDYIKYANSFKDEKKDKVISDFLLELDLEEEVF